MMSSATTTHSTIAPGSSRRCAARRHHTVDRAEQIHAALRREQLALPAQLVAAYAAIVRAVCPLIAAFNAQISQLQQQVQDLFDQHSDVEIYRSQPGLGDILGARVLGEFGDDPDRFGGARARKNYAGNSPITRASGKKRTVTARRVRNNRLADPLHQQAFSALTCSPGARAYYDRIRARGTSHHAALRQLSNRLVGILHGCLPPVPLRRGQGVAHRTAGRTSGVIRTPPALPRSEPSGRREERGKVERPQRSEDERPCGATIVVHAEATGERHRLTPTGHGMS